MGSNNWLRAMSAAALVVATLGPTSAADLLDGVKGHIDIPEITRTRKSTPSITDPFAGIVDEFGTPTVSTPIVIDPDERMPDPIIGGGMVPGDLSNSLSRLIVTAPQGTADLISAGEEVRAVPAPSTFAPLMVLAFGFGRRRRA